LGWIDLFHRPASFRGTAVHEKIMSQAGIFLATDVEKRSYLSLARPLVRTAFIPPMGGRYARFLPAEALVGIVAENVAFAARETATAVRSPPRLGTGITNS
jgi:hypothetical protein